MKRYRVFPFVAPGDDPIAVEVVIIPSRMLLFVVGVGFGRPLAVVAVLSICKGKRPPGTPVTPASRNC